MGDLPLLYCACRVLTRAGPICRVYAFVRRGAAGESHSDAVLAVAAKPPSRQAHELACMDDLRLLSFVLASF
jgi:hypothetical protein